MAQAGRPASAHEEITHAREGKLHNGQAREGGKGVVKWWERVGPKMGQDP